VVAGGGPVGLATALYAARAGLDVELREPRPGPIDKACGEGLMPGAVTRLEALGVTVDGVRLAGIRYLAGPHRVAARFRHGPGRGVRRTTLHAALHDAVVAAGVPVRRSVVRRVEQAADRVLVDGEPARFLVAADGLHSPVRRGIGLQAPAAGPRRYGLRAHVAVRPWTDLVEVHWARHAEAYLGRTRGAGPLRQRTTRRVAGRVLLVGDAAGYVDALTGEGIASGLAQAEVAVAAVAAGDPAGYEAAWRRLTRRHDLLTRGLVTATRVPLVRRALVPAAVRLPRVFESAVDQLARPG
jgi:flavin-dependent dehydrogenase